MITHKYVKDLLSSYSPYDETESNFKLELEVFVDKYDDITTRENTAGHIIASGYVVSSDKQRMLLVHHKKIQKWFQPGGHVEPEDETLQQTAIREVLEETGLALIPVEDAIFDIDIHTIPKHQGVEEHKHYDVRFLFVTDQTDFSVSDESHDAKWIDFADVSQYNNEIALQHVIKKIRSI